MLTAIFRAIQSTGATPSANAVLACVRRHRYSFRDADAKAHLAALGPWPGPESSGPAPLFVLAGTGTRQKAPTRPRLRRRAQITKELLKADSSHHISDTDSLRSSGASGDVEPEKQNAKSKQQQPWVIELREAARLIADTTLRNLTLEERSVCGRYHAFRFENCTKSEARNVNAGAKAAVAFAKMGDSSIYADFTVREYVDHAVVFQREFMRGAPFYDPFAIRAVIEARKAAERGR